MDLAIQRLDRAREADFERLHAARCGGPGCHCVAWWVPTWEGWGERTEEGNRDLRAALFARGEHDGWLAYADGEPAGWCQVGPRDRLEKLRAQFGLEPDPDTWAVTCFFVREDLRRSGIARRMLARILEELAARGVRRLEAFPKRAVEPGELWNGPEALFLAAGFRVVREDALRPVLALELVD